MKHLAGAVQQPVVVENYHQFARGYLSSRGKLPPRSICSPQDRSQFIRLALHETKADGVQSPILQRPEKFFDEEFRWIQQHGIADKQDYIDKERIGRTKARVARADRPVLFDLYTLYLSQRQRGGKLYDWDDLAGTVLGELQSDRKNVATATWS